MQRTFAFLLALLALGAVAQETTTPPSGIGLLFPSTDDSTYILRDGVRIPADPDNAPVLLLPGDQLSTTDATVEMQLYPSLTRVLLGENTSIALDEISSAVALGLQFGRVLVTIGADATGVTVHGFLAEAASGAGSFGFDQVVDVETGAIVTRVYSYEGDVAVTTTDSEPSEERIELTERTMIVRQRGTEQVEPKTLSPGVTDYWEARPATMVVFDPLDVLEQYPDLADAIVNEAGVLPPFLIRPVKVAAADEAADEPVPEPDMKPSERTGTAEDPQEMAQADAAAASDGETTSATPAVVSQPEEFPLQTDEDELRARRSNVLRHTGAVLTGVGFLADAGALALSFFGDDLFSTWPGNGEDVLTPIAYGGGGLVTVGLLMYAVATIIGN